MPDTRCFETFEYFIQTSINELLEETNSDENAFLKRFRIIIDNVRGEARRNQEEYKASGKDSIRFFYDLHEKLNHLEFSLFETIGNRLVYLPMNIAVNEENKNIIQIFLWHIYNAIQEIKNCFASYLPLPPHNLAFRTSVSRLILTVDQRVLNDAYNQLIQFGYIPEGTTDKRNFINVFTGGMVQEPILWLDHYNSLAYLIRGLLNSGALRPLKNKHWKEVQKFFITEEGKITDTNQLRSSDPPEDTTNLRIIIDTFCNHNY